MKVELQRFVEFKAIPAQTRDDMVFEPVLMELDYVAWVKRFQTAAIEMCEVSFVDHGRAFIIDKTYEEMRELLQLEKETQT